MNHSEFVAAVAESGELSKADAARAVDAVFGTIRGVLTSGDEVRVSGFGAFSVGQRAARSGRNPRTGETIKIKASKVARFSPAKAVKDSLNGPKKSAKKPAARKASKKPAARKTSPKKAAPKRR